MSWSAVKARIKDVAPEALRKLWQRHQLATIRRRNRGRAVQEIFSEIYDNNRWGGERGSFCSGSGSTDAHALVYAATVKEFIRQHGIRSVVDLGCGDFRVAAQLLDSGIEYLGIDIVEGLVRENTRVHGTNTVRFACMDIIEVPPPAADLCLVRQVLQHLSNQQILKVLQNVRHYPYVLVTEHYPAPQALRGKNFDKPCGEDVRIYDGSAVFLDAEPFNVVVSAPVLDVDAGRYAVCAGERIRTFLLRNGHPPTRH